jgi:hypothetical protein
MAAEDLGPWPVARSGFDVIPISERVVERLPAELAAAFGVRLQRRGGLAQPLALGAKLVDHAIRRAASTA